MLNPCCTSIVNLGCIGNCDCVKTGINATKVGEYTIEWHQRNKEVSRGTTTPGIGNEIKFQNFMLEGATNIFKIVDPDGNYVLSGSADCFQVEVKVSKTKALTSCT